jgi:hypothetical protein
MYSGTTTNKGGFMTRLEYTYTADQVRVYAEGESSLTPLEVTLLDHIDELYLYMEVER